MLTEAEDQRKKDTFECEEFTRCKSNKVRTRAANYEYIDIDTAQKVDFSEFEMRYFYSFCLLSFSFLTHYR